VTTLANLLVIGRGVGLWLAALWRHDCLLSCRHGCRTFSDNQAAQLLALGLPFTVASIWLGVSERRWFVGGFGMLAPC
jgi:hypothetical protein